MQSCSDTWVTAGMAEANLTRIDNKMNNENADTLLLFFTGKRSLYVRCIEDPPLSVYFFCLFLYLFMCLVIIIMFIKFSIYSFIYLRCHVDRRLALHDRFDLKKEELQVRLIMVDWDCLKNHLQMLCAREVRILK